MLALIVLALILTALSAVATFVAVDARAFANLQAKRLDNFTSFVEGELAALEAADQANLALIESHILQLLNRINTVNSTLTTETLERIAKDMILMANVSSLDGRLTTAEGTLVNATTDIGYLYSLLNMTNSSGTAFMTLINDMIANETAARVAKDMELMGNVTTLESDLAAEEAARIAKDMQLMGNVSSLESDLAAEEAARIAKDNILMINVTTLESLITAEEAARLAKDTILMQNVSDLLVNITFLDGSVVKTINSLSPLSSNMILNTVSPGLALTTSGNMLLFNNTGVTSNIAGQGIVVDQPTGVVTISTTAILTMNGVAPTGPGNIGIDGVSGITINNTLTPNTVTVDGSTLVTSIANVQSEVSMHSMEITALNNTVNAQQTTIDNLQAALNMTQMALNGTVISINMTFMQLIMDVMTLQSQVAALQAQLANLTSVAVPTGTIVPWGGTNMNVPAGYLLCDGATVAISTYMDLYTAIGCKFCAAMTCTMTDFCLPDLRGKLPVGKSETIGSAFNVVAGTGGIGEEKHTLITAELPAHTHGDDHAHFVEVLIPITDNPQPTSYWTTNNEPSNWFATADGYGGYQCDISNPTIFTQSMNGHAGNCDTANHVGCTDDNPYHSGGATNCPGEGAPGFAEEGIYFRRQYGSGLKSNAGGGTTTQSTGSGTSHNVVQPAVVIAGHMIKT